MGELVLCADGAAMSEKMGAILDRCPSCENNTLFVGSGGWLTCSWLSCEEPGVTRSVDALKERIVELETDLHYARTELNDMKDGM